MAVIHKTTATPGKLDMLAAWLPTRPWYRGDSANAPELTKAGGFRLDDPAGEVGLEFMVVTDASGARPVSYHVPVSYRGAPLDGVGAGAIDGGGSGAGAEQGLVGTMEHGVLGKRWVYDGAHDPVLVTQLLALLQGLAKPQAQNLTDTPDPSVIPHFAGGYFSTSVASMTVTDEQHGTDVLVSTTPDGPVTLTLTRVLRPGSPSAEPEARASVAAPWQSPDGTTHRAPFALLRDSTP